MPPTPPRTPTSPHRRTTTIRPREPGDLQPLVDLLQTVYEQDAYPVQGTTHAREFLTQASTLRAWVAESFPDGEGEEGKDVGVVGNGREWGDGERGKGRGQIVGHVAVSRPREGDVAVRLWRRLHPRNDSTGAAGGQERREQEEQGDEVAHEEEDVEEAEGIAVLERLFIHPTARNHGLASRLLLTAEEWAAGTTSLRPNNNNSEEDPPETARSGGESTTNQEKNPKKEEGIRLLLFALLKDESAMRLYRRRGWTEFGRTGFTYDGPSRDAGGDEKDKREMEAICFVSPVVPPPPSPAPAAVAG
ncbi:hypothetical protein NU219Hw_g3380t1 [Hortaea werneckii]